MATCCSPILIVGSAKRAHLISTCFYIVLFHLQTSADSEVASIRGGVLRDLQDAAEEHRRFDNGRGKRSTALPAMGSGSRILPIWVTHTRI